MIDLAFVIEEVFGHAVLSPAIRVTLAKISATVLNKRRRFCFQNVLQSLFAGVREERQEEGEEGYNRDE